MRLNLNDTELIKRGQLKNSYVFDHPSETVRVYIHYWDIHSVTEIDLKTQFETFYRFLVKDFQKFMEMPLDLANSSIFLLLADDISLKIEKIIKMLGVFHDLLKIL